MSEASALISRHLVWDNHGCMPLRADASHLPQLERYRRAGVDIVSLNVGFADMTFDEHLKVLDYMRRWIAERQDRYGLIESVTDIDRLRREGRLGIIFDVEGLGPVIGAPERIATFYRLGVRWMLIAYNRSNAAGGGCLDEDLGLTDAGRALIEAMDQVGMVLCLSHCGERTALEALDHARGPAILSHSNPAGAAAHPRNVSDRVISACAAKGGVIGLSGIGLFLGGGTRPVERYVAQLLYLIDLVGPAHVGIGLDYIFDRAELDALLASSPTLFPADAHGDVAMLAPESISEIVEGLLAAGLGEPDIASILGGNWRRVAQAMWR